VDDLIHVFAIQFVDLRVGCMKPQPIVVKSYITHCARLGFVFDMLEIVVATAGHGFLSCWPISRSACPSVVSSAPLRPEFLSSGNACATAGAAAVAAPPRAARHLQSVRSIRWLPLA